MTYDKVRDMISPNEEPPSARLLTSIEPMPNHESRVILGEDRDALGQRRVELRLRHTEADVHTIIRGTELLATRFAAEGLGRIRSIIDAEGVRKRLGGRNHHMCTTRMHSDPKKGVVDADCRVHGVENLFVAGSSVFTTAGAGVPTMNLVALALRLAEYIRGKS
jgi:choline dehydrogenase-like flavoprotein